MAQKIFNPICRRTGISASGLSPQGDAEACGLSRRCTKAADDYVGFWADLATAEIDWHRPFTVPLDDADAPNFRWFTDGTAECRTTAWTCTWRAAATRWP
jgi:hypothetical protein